MTASTTAPRIWVYKNVADGPAEALELEDTDSNWEELLSTPQVLESKGDSPAFCGCEFAAGSERRLLKNAVQTHCFIFDVDVWRSDRPPFTLDELKAALEGFRFIAYTSYSSTDAALRWRVILPVSPPVPISKHVPLFRWVNKHGLDNTVADKVRDATRYGYFGTVASEAAVTALPNHWCDSSCAMSRCADQSRLRWLVPNVDSDCDSSGISSGSSVTTAV